eukprot:1503049-Lingulodinium_polyedra.AAC.1
MTHDEVVQLYNDSKNKVFAWRFSEFVWCKDESWVGLSTKARGQTIARVRPIDIIKSLRPSQLVVFAGVAAPQAAEAPS